MRAYLLAPLGLALLATACGESTGERATTGAGSGAIAGAVVGGPVGAVVGGGIGAAGGAYRPEVDQYVGTKTETITQNATSTTTSGAQIPAASSSGVSHDQVLEAQNALQKMGYYHGKIDGLYGKQTAAAVRDFQAKENLKKTGTLNQTTMQHLRSGVASSSGDAPGSTPSGTSGSNAPEAGGSSGTSGGAGDTQMNK